MSNQAARFDTDKAKSEWQKFYRHVFGLACDFSGVNVPVRRPGFDRLLIIAGGLTGEGLCQKCGELFPFWVNQNLQFPGTSDRDPGKGSYAVWVRANREADEEHEHTLAEELMRKGVAGITLEERLVYEIKFFDEMGTHLDQWVVTLCTGSRFFGGQVPRVHWRYVNNRYRGKLIVYGYDPEYCKVRLRIREVVSLNPTVAA